MSSTPRRGELRILLSMKGMKMAKQTLRTHIAELERDGYIKLDGNVIVLLRWEPITDEPESVATTADTADR